ncbi:MAG: HAD-superfamily hydrolase subfamily [Acidimicrobiales bacterium]|jgi:histidinol-phosphate phosphatase family protein|nr:HAD-superfamily hydrolase subfamily [Acidimicrobiales bacterium]
MLRPPTTRVAVVVPTIGRPSLDELLRRLATSTGPLPQQVLLVDDRRERTRPLVPTTPASLAGRVQVVPGGGRGPAHARNVGWRRATTEWVAFLDDDVAPTGHWLADLAIDLRGLPYDVAGCQGHIEVLSPTGRARTDWERDVAGLESAQWATADMAYRRRVLRSVGGFDERFPRAYREDADLGLRVTAAGWRIVRGSRVIRHPVRPAPWWISVRRQAGNADDPLMAMRHGPDWRQSAGAPHGRFRRHLVPTTGLAAAVGSAAAGRRRVAHIALAVWIGGTAEFAWRRIRPGPRTPAELATMVATSVAIPPVAVYQRVRGMVAARRRPPARECGAPGRAADAVLFDRDGTLIVDVPYNGDPGRVTPVAGARRALDRLRAAGVALGVVTNQSGVGRGRLGLGAVDAVNRRIDELLGPFDVWAVCPHRPADGCGCRKPASGLVDEAARALGTDAIRCVVIGDIGGDVDAALAAGARAILVPNAATSPAEIATAPEVASDLDDAVSMVLAARVGP